MLLAHSQQRDSPKNVLLIPVDDLRPELFGAYEQKYMYTPHLDKLAKESFVFQRAYCQHAVCIPSRNSFLTGKRPDTTKVWAGLGNAHFRITGPNWISLPEHFKNNGYTTLGGGKTYHPNHPPNWDEPLSWSQDIPYYSFKSAECPDEVNEEYHDITKIDTWCPLDEGKYPDSFHYDWKLANHTIELLKYVQNKGGPWFVAAGFRRPHVPWMMPKRFYDMYQPSAIPTVLHRSRPKGSPDIAYHTQGVRAYNSTDHYLPMPKPFPVSIEQEVRRSYMASVSWVDSQIGRVLDALEQMKLSEETLVVVFGDHGYQLGEHDSWHKQTNWELVPLIIRAPWKPHSQGQTTYGLVELVDLYRTISDLVGAPEPAQDIEGTSFASLFDNPVSDPYEASRVTKRSLTAAFSQYPRCPQNHSAEWDNNSCPGKGAPVYMGYSMRTPEWRYTAWMPWDVDKQEARWESEPYAVELYDQSEMSNDFNQCEIENVANQNTDLVMTLHDQMKDFFKK